MDYLVRGISEQFNFVGLACMTTDLVEQACRIHGTSRTASAALGRALTGALLMSALLKRGQRVALKFEGNGPLKKIIVEADHEGAVRGFVASPGVEVAIKDEKLNVSGALGSGGVLTVTKDLGLREPYRGIVSFLTGEIAEDIAYYFLESEQIPSAVGLGVFVAPEGKISAAGGFLLQSLPPAEPSILNQIVQNIRQLASVTEILRQGKKPEDLLSLLFSGVGHRFLERRLLFFRCNCSEERVGKALISLGPKEFQKMITEQEATEVTCEFCRRTYRFTRKKLEDLLEQMGRPAGNT